MASPDGTGPRDGARSPAAAVELVRAAADLVWRNVPPGEPLSPAAWRDRAVAEALALAQAAGPAARLVDTLATGYDSVLAHEPRHTSSGRVALRRTAHAERRFRGAFATPARLADAVARRAISPGALPATVLDPACGTGALLRAALRRLIDLGVPPPAAAARLHGVELDPVAARICRAAVLADLEVAGVGGAQLEAAAAGLRERIVVGEALLGPGRNGSGARDPHGAAQGTPAGPDDAAPADPAATADGPPSVVWHETFPAVLGAGGVADPVTGWSGGFDAVLANPPWERLKVSRRDWDGAPPTGLRDERVRLAAALRARGRHPLTGHGELNAYLLFVETCWRLLGPRGRACVIVPAGFVTDRSAAPLLQALVGRGVLDRLHLLAPDVAAFAGVSARVGVALVDLRGGPVAGEPAADGAVADGPAAGGPGAGVPPARMAVGVRWSELEAGHFPQEWAFGPAELAVLSPNTGSPPPCTGPRDAELLTAAHGRWDVLARRRRPAADGPVPPVTGPAEPVGPWQVRLVTPLHMTRDARWFEGAPRDGLLPVWEAKHAGLLDPRGGTGRARYWVPRELVERRFGRLIERGWLAGYRNVTTVDAPRTLLPTPLPVAGVGNSLPLIDAPRLPLLLACLASLPLDYLARQKHAGPNLNFFKLEQLPVPAPHVYDAPAPWEPAVPLGRWVLARLVDAVPWAGAGLDALLGELRRDGVPSGAGLGRPEALAELDAAHAVLLGWDRGDLDHVIGTFGALRARDERSHNGRFVTRERILAAFDRLTN